VDSLKYYITKNLFYTQVTQYYNDIEIRKVMVKMQLGWGYKEYIWNFGRETSWRAVTLRQRR
jgi:hypothetical protein